MNDRYDIARNHFCLLKVSDYCRLSGSARMNGYDMHKEVRARAECYYMDEGRKVVYQYRGAHGSSRWPRGLGEAQLINKIPKLRKSLYHYDKVCT
jgi:hypothetical protein